MRRGKNKWEGVSRTAHFTAAVWHDLGVPGAEWFVTRQGQILNWIVNWGGGFFGLRGRYSVTNLFLASRHLGLDALLAQRNPAQVIELAAGLASRGSQWVQAHPGTYLEIDQPALVAAKQQILAPLLASLPHAVTYRLIPADLLGWSPESVVRSPESKIQSLASSVQRPASSVENSESRSGPRISDSRLRTPDYGLPTTDSGLVLIISEGMTGYLGEEALRRLLKVIREMAEGFDECTILIDFYLKLNFRQHGRVYLALLPARLLWRILRAPMQMFLRDAEHIRALVNSEGFQVEQLYSGGELAGLAGIAPPPLDLFYLAELRLTNTLIEEAKPIFEEE